MSKLVMPRPCKTCPFRKSSPGAFDPQTLDNTVGDNLRTGYAHRCHQGLGRSPEPLCAGFVAFVERHEIQNQMLRIAGRMGLYTEDEVSAEGLELESWDAVLAMHRRRLG